ncbi:MAG: haloacid dehalogenase type II, partial [Candidatus Rokuibacteriota bacterium]
MATTLGFDVYGTLIDTAGIADALGTYVGSRAGDFAAAWRAKQLEYAFRRGLMQNYRDFSECTRQALAFTAALFKVTLGEADSARLLDAYRRLPAYPDAAEGLTRLRASAFRMYAFSMGRTQDVIELLGHARLSQHFDDVITLEDARLFKPSPGAYSHFLRHAGCVGAEAWLVSGNSFDVMGAVSAGLNGAWVRRAPDALLDPWEIQPTLVAADLPTLHDALIRREPGVGKRSYP